MVERGVKQMLTIADKGGRGSRQMLTSTDRGGLHILKEINVFERFWEEDDQ